MRILVSNDDGYQSPGIETLVQILSDIAHITVVAPIANQSASSSSLSINKDLRPIKIKPNFYVLDGTPSDCVHLALCGFFDKTFDLVVTGINLGANLGDDVIYSGTVAGAIEGRFLGLPSIAISLVGDTGSYFETAAQITRKLVSNIAMCGISPNSILNVNVPDIVLSALSGYQSTRLGGRHASESIVVDKNHKGVYHIGNNGKESDNGIGTDFYAISHRFVSVTPLQIDLTKYREMEPLSTWLAKINS